MWWHVIHLVGSNMPCTVNILFTVVYIISTSLYSCISKFRSTVYIIFHKTVKKQQVRYRLQFCVFTVQELDTGKQELFACPTGELVLRYLKNKHCQFENAAMLGVIHIMNGQSMFLESICRANKYLAKNPTALWCQESGTSVQFLVLHPTPCFNMRFLACLLRVLLYFDLGLKSGLPSQLTEVLLTSAP